MLTNTHIHTLSMALSNDSNRDAVTRRVTMNHNRRTKPELWFTKSNADIRHNKCEISDITNRVNYAKVRTAFSYCAELCA